jgi:hypothetical protein
VLGIGIGALVGAWAEGLGPWLLGVGALAHGWGMYDKRRVARGSGFADPWWSAALYWACWVSLGLGASALSARLLGFPLIVWRSPTQEPAGTAIAGSVSARYPAVECGA